MDSLAFPYFHFFAVSDALYLLEVFPDAKVEIISQKRREEQG